MIPKNLLGTQNKIVAIASGEDESPVCSPGNEVYVFKQPKDLYELLVTFGCQPSVKLLFVVRQDWLILDENLRNNNEY